MNPDFEVITKFYIAFNHKDASGMNACYADDIRFFDPVFGMLRNGEVYAMWEMLCNSAKDLQITHSNIKDLGDNYYTCDWVAAYTYSPTGKKVVNKCRANMKIFNGIISEHSDAFSLHRWASQAYGIKGWFFGSNVFFQRRLRKKARQKLLKWIERKDRNV